MNTYWESGGTIQHILNSVLGGSEYLVSRSGLFTPLGNGTFDMRLGGPQSQSGRGGKHKNLSPPVTESGKDDNLVTILAELHRLLSVT